MWSLTRVQRRLCRDLQVLLPPPPLLCCVALSKAHTFSLSQFPSLEMDLIMLKAGGTLQRRGVTAQKEKCTPNFPSLFCPGEMGAGRKHSALVCSSSISVGTRQDFPRLYQAIREITDNAFNLAGVS